MKVKQIILVLGALCLVAFSAVDEIKQDFIAINKKMNSAKNYSAKISVVYDYVKTDKIIKASTKKMGNNYFSQFEDNILLSNKKCLLVINDENKIICVQDADEEEQVNENAYNAMLDTIFNKNFTYSIDKKAGDYKVVKTKLQDKNAPYSEIKITYHSKKHYFKQIEYLCTGKVKQSGLSSIRIVYDEFNYSPALSEKDFDESVYVKIKGKSVTAAPAYKKYKIIDQRLDR